MHNEDVHTQSIGEFHQVLLDDAMGAGIGASAIAQDDNGMGIGILVLKMRLPYPWILSQTNWDVSWFIPRVMYPVFVATS